MKLNPQPISAIVIFRNERELLEGCLRSLRWCDELIAVDMRSTDGSLLVAQRLADRVMHVDPSPIAEPTRVAAAKLAAHDWVLLVDPDEHMPSRLVSDIRDAMHEHPSAGAFRLPMRYYFKRQLLTGTIWAGAPGRRPIKRRLIHRDRCKLLPLCNRITEMVPGFHEHTIKHNSETETNANFIRHYWSDSYLELARRHLLRYCFTEAAAMHAQGERFSLWRGFVHPLSEAMRCLRDYDGRAEGGRGWALTAIYAGYTLLADWLLLWHQLRGKRQPGESIETPLPELREDPRPMRDVEPAQAEPTPLSKAA